MKAISGLWQRNYATVRQLEQYGYRILKPLVVAFGVGVILCLTSLFVLVGVILIALSGLVLVGMFAWMIQLQKQPRRDVRCPYCTNKNSVFAGVSAFDCDFCERPVTFDASGTPVPADDSFTEKPRSVFEQEPEKNVDAG